MGGVWIFSGTAHSVLDGCAMLMRPNKAETAVHGCYCPGDMTVCMHEILAIG